MFEPLLQKNGFLVWQKKLHKPFIKPAKEKVKLTQATTDQKDYQERKLLIEPVPWLLRNQVKLKKDQARQWNPHMILNTDS